MYTTSTSTLPAVDLEIFSKKLKPLNNDPAARKVLQKLAAWYNQDSCNPAVLNAFQDVLQHFGVLPISSELKALEKSPLFGNPNFWVFLDSCSGSFKSVRALFQFARALQKALAALPAEQQEALMPFYWQCWQNFSITLSKNEQANMFVGFLILAVYRLDYSHKGFLLGLPLIQTLVEAVFPKKQFNPLTLRNLAFSIVEFTGDALFHYGRRFNLDMAKALLKANAVLLYSIWVQKKQAKFSRFLSSANILVEKTALPMLSSKALWYHAHPLALANTASHKLDSLEALFHGLNRHSIQNLTNEPVSKKQLHILNTRWVELYEMAGWQMNNWLRISKLMLFDFSLGQLNALRQLNCDDATLHFFAKEKVALLPAEIHPLWDYINYERQQNPAYSLKGRTLQTMRRAMEHWHRQMRFVGKVDRTWNGIAKEDLTVRFFGKEYIFEQLTTSYELVDEGAAQHHCVASYANRAARALLSIWSCRLISEEGIKSRLLTIEVSNSLKIVQVRGKYNRVATREEEQLLRAWARLQGFEV